MRDTTRIGLADVIVAIETLQAHDEKLASRIGEILLVEPPLRIEPELRKPKKSRSGAAVMPEQPPPLRGQPVRPESRPSSITRSQSSASSFVAPLPPLPPATDEEHELPPPLQPLFQPAWTRAMLSTALATPSSKGAIDVDRVAVQLARGEAITRLPCRLTPTLRKGVQLLVDHGNGMIPFRRDAAWLAREIVRVAGSDNTHVLRFRGLPSRGVANPRTKTRGVYAPPPRAVPIVLISDLGIGMDDLDTSRATTNEWVDFLQSLRRTNTTVLAFVPYPHERCPQRLARLITLIELDRSTSLSHIRSTVMHLWSNRE